MTNYDNAPITEAVIDIRIKSIDTKFLTELENINKEIKNEFPIRNERHKISGQFSFGNQISHSNTTNVLIGYVFSSQNGADIFQARLDGFTYSRLKPYEKWENLKRSAIDKWNKYKKIVGETFIERIAVRYINKINIPKEKSKIQDYLNTYPHIPKEFPDTLNGFLLQFQNPHVDIQSTLLLNQAILPQETQNEIPVLLDIDLYRTSDIPDDDEQLWKVFEILRKRKNEIFESCITDETRRLIS